MKILVFLKNFFILGILILSFSACSSSKQSDKSPDTKDPPSPGTENTPPSFDESINTEFSFDESPGAELAKPSKIEGAVLEATDPDDDTLTYELVEMDAHPGDHTHFTVNSKTGQIAKKNKNYDYETKSSYTFAVKVSDNASPPQSDQIQVTLTVNNLNETPLAPTGLTISSGDSKLVVSWKAPGNTGRPEITDYIIYWDTTSGGTTNEEMSGGDTIYTLTGLNNRTTYYVHVKSKNADGLGKASLIESGTPVSGNSRPVIQEVVDKEVGEGETSSVAVLVLDADNGDTITLTATSGTPAAITVPSQIPSQTVANGSVSFTFDITVLGTPGTSSTITLIAQDDSGDSTTNTSIQSTFDIDVIELNTAPTFTGVTDGVISFNAVENQRAIGTVSATDINSEDTVTYSIPQLANKGGVDRKKFTIESTTGVLSFSSNFLPDKEAASDSLQPAIAGAPENAANNNEYIVVVRATSGAGGRTLHTDQAIKVTVTDVNEAPVFSSSLTITFSIQEDVGSDIGTAIAITNAIVTATDPDSDTLTYTLEEVISHTGDHNDFTIDSTGQISRKNQNYDYEDQSSYTFAVKAADADFSSQIEVTINISNNNTETPLAPTGLTITPEDSQLVVNWQAPSNTGRPNISGYKVYWDITSGGTANEHTINTATTTYTITGLSNLTTYYVHVKARNFDGLGLASSNISGVPSSVNVAPTFSGVTNGVISFDAAENQRAIGTVSATDINSEDTVTYSIPQLANEGGVDREKFTIESTTGILSFDSNFLPDKEAASDSLQPAIAEAPENAANNNEYIVVVRATSGAGSRVLHTDQAIKVAVTNVNEAPVFSGSPTTTFSIQEDVGSDIGTASVITNAIVTATDPESDTLTYTLEEVSNHTGDHNDFTIDSTGQISRKNQNYDYEDQSSYTFAVKAADAALFSQIEVTINISNNNTETPLAPTGLTITPEDSQLVVSWQAPPNTGRPDISGYIVFWGTTSGGGGSSHTINTATTTFTLTGLSNLTTYYVHVKARNVDGLGLASSEISGVPSSGNFISVWTMSDTDKSITLPLRATFNYDFTVDWGDGSSSQVTSYDDADATHTYDAAGDYTVTISGLVESWYFNGSHGPQDYNDHLQITSVEDFGRVGWKNLYYAFEGCTNLTTVKGKGGDISQVTNMGSMFANTDKLDHLSVENWDVSNVRSMTQVFHDAPLVNPDVSKWDVSNVTDMSYMFSGATSANPNVSDWNVSNVTNMSNMFSGATSANPDVSKWNTSNVIIMGEMFFGATSSNPDMSKLNFRRVNNMLGMFRDVTLSTTNYSNLLIRINETTQTNSVTLDGGNSKYNTSGETARDELINNRSWTITDGGLEP